MVKVQHNHQSQELVLTVVTEEGPSILGRDWLKCLQLDWRGIHALSKHAVGSLEYLFDKHAVIFNDELGTIKSFSAELNVDPSEKLKFFKACTVPFALHSAIENELDITWSERKSDTQSVGIPHCSSAYARWLSTVVW